MLNMLIAIMGNTFDNVIERKSVFAMQMRLNLLSDYRNIINLEAHRDRKTKDELLSLTIRSVMFVILLRHGGYFGQKETPYGLALSKAEATIADIVFCIQEGIQYNLHQVGALS